MISCCIGRFVPCHPGHESLLRETLIRGSSRSRRIIYIGSASAPLSTKNPFTYAERIWLMENQFKNLFDGARSSGRYFEFKPLIDDPSDDVWAEQFKRDWSYLENEHDFSENQSHILNGYMKPGDPTVWYFDFLKKKNIFTLFNVKEANNYGSSTIIRDLIYNKNWSELQRQLIRQDNIDFFKFWITTPIGMEIQENYFKTSGK